MYICGCARHYGSQIVRLNGGDLEPEFQISLIDSWIVKQKDGDYNPLHHHAGELSGIIYVSVPKQVSDTSTPDGNLIFAHGQFKLSNLDLLGVREIVPKRGEMFIFPAWMQHAVYPFSGEGERLSYAFNLRATGLRQTGE